MSLVDIVSNRWWSQQGSHTDNAHTNAHRPIWLQCWFSGVSHSAPVWLDEEGRIGCLWIASVMSGWCIDYRGRDPTLIIRSMSDWLIYCLFKSISCHLYPSVWVCLKKELCVPIAITSITRRHLESACLRRGLTSPIYFALCTLLFTPLHGVLLILW